MINHEKKLIHLHIPKTGGTSLRNALKQCNFKSYKVSTDNKFNLPGRNLPLGHKYPLHYPFADYKIFCFVRNPWDRFISEYFWRKTIVIHKTRNTFYIPKNIQDFCDYMLKYNPNNKNLHPDDPMHIESQCSILSRTSPESPNIDFIGRFEDLQNDFINYMKSHGFNNINKLDFTNKSNRKKDYKIYYNFKTKQIIDNLYKDDIEKFGYTFND